MKELTALQWAKAGFVVNSDAEGKERWTNGYHSKKVVYFPESEVHKDEEASKALIQSKRREYRIASDSKKEKQKRFEAIRKNMKTEWQWLQEGRVPIPRARWRTGEELNSTHHTCSFGSSYAYCHIDDTEEAASEQALEAAIEAYKTK